VEKVVRIIKITVCFDDLMAAMSSQDPVFDTSFHPRLLHPSGGAAGWPSPCSPCWPGAPWARTSWPTTWPPCCAISRKQAYIAETNLKICFPHLDEAGRQALLLKSIRVGLKTFMGFGELTWRSPDFLKGRVKVSGWEHMEAERAAGRPMILVVPHTWAVDMIGRYFAIRGSMCTMMKSPKDQVFDWYINRERRGRAYLRAQRRHQAGHQGDAQRRQLLLSAGSGSRPGGEHLRALLRPPQGDPAGPAQAGEADRRQGGAHSGLL
jgi:lauroyl-KDO2-lipid IV(A) myristoyltransferase